MNLLKNKKFQYGSLAVLLTALILAVILVLNIIISMFSSHFGWYADTSSSGLFHFSERSLAMLDEIDRENNEIHIYYFCDENTLSETQYGKYVLTLTSELENRYADDEFVTVHHIEDINADIFEIGAIFGDKYAETLQEIYENRSISNGTMVIRNNTREVGEDGEFIKDTEDYRVDVFSITDMYSEASASFLGDYTLTARILGVCHLSPTVYFLTGHDEMTVAEDGTYGNAEYLVELFDSCGFTAKKLYLAQADFKKDTVKPSIAVIFAPRTDYTQTELDKLSAFVENGGHLMMFADSVQRKLDNLNAFLSQYGIGIGSEKFKSGLDSSLSLGDYTFIAENKSDSSVIQNLADRLPKTVVSDARVILVDAARGASAVLVAPDSAKLNKNEATLTGKEAIAAYSTAQGRGSVFACGAASLASSLIYAPSYANRDVLLSVMQEMGAEDLPINLEVKTLATDGLDLTRGQAVTLTVAVTAIPALLIIAVGTVVYVRRKRS